MSHEINQSTLPPQNNESVEPQPPLPPPQAYRNRVHPQPPDDTTQASTKNASAKQEQFHKIQRSLMVVAVLAAGASYQAGLNPPGGFWQANDDQGHIAGNPVLHDTFPRRYTAFFYCNATAFITSLVIIILLMNIEFYNNPRMIKVLQVTMVLDLFGFMGAYAAGSCRELSSSIYLFLLMGGIFIYVLSFVRHYEVVHNFASRAPCLKPCMTNPV